MTNPTTPDPLSDLQRLGQEFDADVVIQADRAAAADIARIFLGNDDTLPDELRSGSLARHWLLDELARHRIAAIAAARIARPTYSVSVSSRRR